MLPQRDLTALEDMRRFARQAIGFAEGLDRDRFIEDLRTVYACIRCVEVIGEAAGRVGQETQQRHPQLPWPFMKPMRNLIAHEYGRVDHGRIWEVVHHHLPDLVRALDEILGDPDGP